MIIGSAERPAMGEIVCGDKHIIVEGDNTIIAVVDGLGHGPKAAEASEAFCEVVKSNASWSLDEIVQRATKDISGTRGVAGALVRIDKDESRMSFCGIGNIECRALSKNPIRPICIPGIIGRRLRKVKTFEYELSRGDLILLHTDGISTRFDLEKFATLDVGALAEEMLERHGKFHDDATCVVIRLGT